MNSPSEHLRSFCSIIWLGISKEKWFKKIHLEGDALNIIKAIHNKERGLAHIHHVLDCCFNILASFDVSIFSFVRRVGNTAAHMVARWETAINNEKICIPPLPECLRTLAELDLS